MARQFFKLPKSKRQEEIFQLLRKGWVLKIDQPTQKAWLFKRRRIPKIIRYKTFTNLLQKQLLRRIPSNRIDVVWYSNIV